MFPSSIMLGSSISNIKSNPTIPLDFGFRSPTPSSNRMSFMPLNWTDHDDQGRKYTSSSTFPMLEGKLGQNIFKNFCTGSKYTGQFNKLGMAGKGVYKYPHGVVYDGCFNKKGEFHGSGALVYPGGQRVEGIWRNGKLTKGASFITAGDSPFDSQYCRKPDRRFKIEIDNELAAAGQEYLTNAPNPPRAITKGCYDSGEGFFDPQKKVIYDYHDPTSQKPISEFANIDRTDKEIYSLLVGPTPSQEYLLNKLREQTYSRFPKVVAIPGDLLEKWITENCRKAWDEPTRFRPDLYESWESGKLIYERLEPITIARKEDNIIEELAKTLPHSVPVSRQPSVLFSFIKSPIDQTPSESIAPSGEMVLPKEGYVEILKTQTEKKPKLKHFKSKKLKFKKHHNVRNVEKYVL